jgi:FMN phosphatase YigB (HAD superfamily)
MAEQTYLFLDFDDTLCNMAEHRRQLVQELASLLTDEYGGGEDEWAPILAPILAASLIRYREEFGGQPLAGFNRWIIEQRARVAREILEAKGIGLPADTDFGGIAARLQFEALTACNASFPNTEEALRELFDMGVRTQLASSQESEYLLAALIGAGIESYTESKFGPDLVDCAKEGTEFYRRIFAACEISPAQAIVVDDQPECLVWAEEAGAKVIQARLKPDSPEQQFPMGITALSALPAAVRKLAGIES